MRRGKRRARVAEEEHLRVRGGGERRLAQPPRRRVAGIADDDDLDRAHQHLGRAEQAGDADQVLRVVAGKKPYHRLGPPPVMLVPGVQVETDEDLDHGAVAGRHGVVVDALGAGDDVHGVVGRDEVAGAIHVPVVLVGIGDPALRPLQVAGFAARLEQCDRRPRQVGVVLDDGRVALYRAGAPDAMQTPPVLQMRDGEVEGSTRGIEPERFVEHRSRVDQRGDHEAVPVGENLVVATGANAIVAPHLQLGPRAGEGRVGERGFDVQRAAEVEDGVAFPVADGCDAVRPLECRRLLAESAIDFVGGPDVILAFDALEFGSSAEAKAYVPSPDG